ncbi:MAG: cyclic nucleotide-binding domain-containing protein [Pseudomonadales bacterium]
MNEPNVMQVELFDLVIVGAGPAGLSAAGRAAEIDRERGLATPSYVLLESGAELAQTIQSYQLGKHVMDEPNFLDLRSPMRFGSGTREAILAAWEEDLRTNGLNVRYQSEVSAISGAAENFEVTLANGGRIACKTIVLACGTEGNVRLLEVANDAPSNFVRYGLADPAAVSGRTVVVVGAGDSAIENALALVGENKVHIVNRRSEFTRAKSGNLSAIVAAINDPERDLTCHYDSQVKAVVMPPAQTLPGQLILTTPSGDVTIECHLIIARLGSIPPRKFLESCGIAFSSELPGALPVIDGRFQSAVPGLYIVGSLSGCPLIKQAMNQGQDVVDYIAGNDIKPADHELVAGRLGNLYPDLSPDETLALLQASSPLTTALSPITFRELIIESQLIVSGRRARGLDAPSSDGRGPLALRAGTELLAPGDFVNAFYLVVEGNLLIRRYPDADWEQAGPGSFFGESCLFAGRPQGSSVRIRRNSLLIRIPRKILIKLALSNGDIKQLLEDAFVSDLLKVTFEPKMSRMRLGGLARQCPTRTYEAGALLYEQGSSGNCVYLLRSGSVNLIHRETGRVIGDQYAGELVGQSALLGNTRRLTDARATTRTLAIEIDGASFTALLEDNPEIRRRLERDLTLLLQENNALLTHPTQASAMGFLLERGVGEATNALVINSELCIGCDNCERACEDTHGGVSRLHRHGGGTHEGFHVPLACRHCETPHCMKDCPPDAIHRTESGAVYIQDNCIGCGNCESNCPYGAIELVAPKQPERQRWFGLPLPRWGLRDRAAQAAKETEHAPKRAVKCDACHDLPGGPACVRSCPTGAAIRLSAAALLTLTGG